MAGRVEGKVAFITGAARGQGRSHAVRLAQEGADIIGIDICESIPSVEDLYEGPTEGDLEETVRQVEREGRRMIATKADVRDFDALKSAVDNGVAELGHVDIVSANAGIFAFGKQAQDVPESEWQDVVDINQTGVWHTAKAVIPQMIDQGTGGSIIITSSGAGIKGFPNFVAYVGTKHALVGIMKTLAIELADHNIRVNTVHPSTVATPMILNDAAYQLFMPGMDNPSRKDAEEGFKSLNALPIPWVEAIDISNGVLFLGSDEARYITGTELKIDAGSTAK